MAHAVSASYLRSEHMSPPAMVLAVLLHALIAAALWWLSLNRPPPPLPKIEPIEITIEKPKPPEPKPEPKPEPPPEAKQAPLPPPPPIEGLRPPADIISDKPTQVPTPTQRTELAPPQTARTVEPAPAPPPLPPPKPPEPPKPAPAPTPQAHALAVPPANPLPRPPPPKPEPKPEPRQALQPSPLSRPPQRQAAPAPGPDQPTPSPFVNPADVYNRARISDNYLWEVVRKLRGYQYQAHVTVPQGITVLRIVIARDGRLLDVEVVRSSGQPEMDRGVIAGVRSGSPYTPLPPEIKGASATFTLPLVSIANR